MPAMRTNARIGRRRLQALRMGAARPSGRLGRADQPHAIQHRDHFIDDGFVQCVDGGFRLGAGNRRRSHHVGRAGVLPRGRVKLS